MKKTALTLSAEIPFIRQFAITQSRVTCKAGR